jgi:hypothetical protein
MTVTSYQQKIKFYTILYHRQLKISMDNNLKQVLTGLAFLCLAILIIDPLLVNAQTGSTTFLTYKDPQGRFSINYPQGWNVTAATNRFQGYQVQFQQIYGIGNSSAISLLIDKNVTSDARDYIVSVLIPFLRNSFPYFTVGEDLECSKYMLGGHKACSFIYSVGIAEGQIGTMHVATQVNGTLYSIAFHSSPDAFEKNLPIVEKMINSFKIGI